jgi:predicted Zn-dependent peptidase
MRDAIHKELAKLKTEDVTDAELERFKTRAKADKLRGLADNEGLAEQLAEYQTLYGDWREMFKEIAKIDAVTKADIKRVANKTFMDTNRTEAKIEFAPPEGSTPPPAPGKPGGGQ